jgi:RNA polymerase sigma-B factor
MKKYRKQSVTVHGEKQLVDVPVDGELYKADNREEYQRTRSKNKHVSLYDIFPDLTGNVIEAYEQTELLACLREALQNLSGEERQLVNCIYFDNLTQRETAKILGVSQKTVSKKNKQIINKLRDSLKDWL